MPLATAAILNEPKEKLIVALDVDSADSARALIDEIGNVVGAFKIGLQLFSAAGPDFVRELTGAGHRIFLDLKFHDIPNTVSAASIEAARLGVWMFNVHALGGAEMLRRTANSVAEFCEREGIERPKIIGVTVLTSSDANELREIGIETGVEATVLNLARLAAKCSLDGIVASPREAAAVKNAAGGNFLVVTPGIRPASETNDDQKRVNTPADAARLGADYLVVGRPITAADNKREAATAIVNEIAAASDPIPG
jgi:orotidine-5'-phosphate decarboxylase